MASKRCGSTDEAFTKYPDGHTSERILIAVEMLVDRKMRDDLGREFEIDHTRLRYELEIAQNVDEDDSTQLYVKRELLKIIAIEGDDRRKRYAIKSHINALEEESVKYSTIFSFVQKDKDSAILESNYIPPKYEYIGNMGLVEIMSNEPLRRLFWTMVQTTWRYCQLL